MHNAALLLDLLSDGPSHHQLSDLAERSGMSLPTLHRLLRSLMAAGLVEQDPQSSRYGLGAELVRLAEQYLARLPVLTVAGPYLVDLRNSTGGTVTLAVLVGTDVADIDRIDGDDAGGVFRDSSRVRPALSTAAGRILLAHASDAVWARARDEATSPPDDSERCPWRDAEHLVVPARTATERSEIAAPVFGDGGRAVAALSVTAPATTFTSSAIDATAAPQVLRAARTISRALGHG